MPLEALAYHSRGAVPLESAAHLANAPATRPWPPFALDRAREQSSSPWKPSTMCRTAPATNACAGALLANSSAWPAYSILVADR